MQQPAPEHLSREELREGVMKGLYLFRKSNRRFAAKAQLFGSGSIMNEVLAAQELLADYKVAADVWSVTSYKELHYDALQVERWNRLHPDEEPRRAYVAEQLNGTPGVLVAASDYLRLLPDALSGHLDRKVVALGTDGFGRSEARAELRDFFEVDARHIAYATLEALVREGAVDRETLSRAARELEIDADKPNPFVA